MKILPIALAVFAVAILYGSDAADLVPLKLDLPKAEKTGTPKEIKREAGRVEPLRPPGTRPVLMIPQGCSNRAAQKPVTSSDDLPTCGELAMVTDGDKSASAASYVELGPQIQWIQIDLGEPVTIHAVVLWHFHSEDRLYRATVVQVADDKDFTVNVRTIFNNDRDNAAGLGLGKDLEYIEDNEGKLINAKGVAGRFVRCYSRGNSTNDLNHYVEVEVWGKGK